MASISANILSVLLLFMSSMLMAQDLAKLQAAVERASSKEQQFYALVKLSDYWSYQDTSGAFSTLKRARPLIQGNDFLQGVYLFYEAGVYYDYDRAKSQQLYMQGEALLKKFETTEAYEYRARLWHNYGTLEQQKDNEKAFLDITLTHCIPYAQRSGNQDLLLSYFTDVGMVFFNHKDYDRSLDYYNKALALVKSPDQESENLLWTYLNMFDLYYYTSQQEQAEQILQKALDLLLRIPEKKLAGLVYKDKAKLLSLQGRYEAALQSIQEGLQVVSKYNFLHDYTSLKYEEAHIYKAMGNWSAARKILEDILNDPKTVHLSKSKLAMINELSELEASLGNQQRAYELIREYKVLSDSLSGLDFKKQLTEMETKYRTQEKEQEIVLLENQNLLNRTLLFGGIALVSVLGLWFFYAWNARKKRNKHEFILQQQQREIDLSAALISGEEQERKRLARDLHDGLVGRVTGLKMNVERLARDQAETELLDVAQELENVITELRQTAHNLEPSVLRNYGLEEAIQQFCQTMQSPKTKINFYATGLSSLSDKKKQLAILRIIQELLGNAVRHAQASNILLQCSLENHFLMIEIEDDGIGFDVHQMRKGMGLNNLESRVKSIAGQMHIDTKPGEGTHIGIECQL